MVPPSPSWNFEIDKVFLQVGLKINKITYFELLIAELHVFILLICMSNLVKIEYYLCYSIHKLIIMNNLRLSKLEF